MENIKTNSKGIKFESTNYSKESDIAKSERNDCVVCAITKAFEVKYDEAHKFCKDFFDRKDKKGTRAVSLKLDKLGKEKILGKSVTKVVNCEIGGVKRLRADRRRRGEITKVRYTVGRFLRDYKKGTYIIIVRKHAFTIVDGVVFGNTDDAKKTSCIIENAFLIK